MHQDKHEAAVAAFIRSKGITRCPTACALPTQGTVDATDRAALQSYAAARAETHQQKIVGRERSLWAVKIPAVPGE
jgi:GTP cyclohydrolase FolE2